MASLAAPSIPVSWGELLDKLTILGIKRERIAAADARANVVREYELLHHVGEGALREAAVAGLFRELRDVNEALWEIEDAIRAEEVEARFGPSFVALARSVYRKNDERAAIKRRIDRALGSELTEEKSYWSAA
ncbi:DUF6165 family protein [Sphingomonas sp. KR1UV-12]|uniref:DUF6165 family protein n=1 Tax=Sphingomonas aurea TaxID=3063994 RepID=A0ABT9EL87_9SPHN|nr:DUF6165 family protein [Sphingomonas sp. KR1UV-12]MDP1027729.1 DUF6165 family protein [Sphingomonas sp. KR1UV-12]